MNKLRSLFFLSVFYVLPLLTYAANTPVGGGSITTPPGGGSITTPPSGGQGVNVGNPVGLKNPLKSDSLMELIQDIIDIVLVFAVPIIVFFIILAGFNFVMAKGDPTKVGKAKSMLLYVLIGGVLILGAQVLMSVIAGTVDEFRS